MRSNYTDYKPGTINRNVLINLCRHVGQDDKVWNALITLLVGRTEEWWGSVMDVGLNPELTKWSVRLGPAIVLTGKGYKEHHWLVVPSINHFGYLYTHTATPTLPCPCPPAPSLKLKIDLAGVGPLFVSAVKPETAPMLGGPSLPLCLMRKDTA